MSFITNLLGHYRNQSVNNRSLLDASLDATLDSCNTIKNTVWSPQFYVPVVAGFALGTQLSKITAPLTSRLLKVLTSEVKDWQESPWEGWNLAFKVSGVCFLGIYAPIVEELVFRGELQGFLKNSLQASYEKMGTSKHHADIAARASTIFFSSLIFGSIHFTNAFITGSSPAQFLPQVINTTILGIVFGVTKEVSGGLALPIGLHMGNNTLGALNLMGHALS